MQGDNIPVRAIGKISYFFLIDERWGSERGQFLKHTGIPLSSHAVLCVYKIAFSEAQTSMSKKNLQTEAGAQN